MKIGMNLLLYTAAPDESSFPIAARMQEMGFDGVEWPLFGMTAATADKVGQFNKASGLGATTATVCGEGENPVSPKASEREAAFAALCQKIELTARLGGETLAGPIVQTLGLFTGAGPQPDEWQRMVEFLRKLAPVAEQHNVTLAVEYLNRFEIYMLNTSAAAKKLCDEVNHPRVKILVDSFHSNIEEKNLFDPPVTAARHLGHIHISENDRGVPGSGRNIAWKEYFSGIKAAGYDGWLTIEAFGSALPALAAATKIWRPLFNEPDDVPRQGLAFIRKMLAET